MIKVRATFRVRITIRIRVTIKANIYPKILGLELKG